MQNKILLLIAIFLSLVLIGISSDESTTYFSDETIIVKDAKSEKVDKLNLEEYIVGVVAAEMPASFHEEALKAQAIAARTYAAYKMEKNDKSYDVVTDVSNQSYVTIDEMKDKWKDDFEYYYNKVKDSVEATKNMIMKYNGDIVEAYYYSMSNGYSEKASLVFSEDKDYLQSVEIKYDNKNINNFSYTKNIKKEEFCKQLDINCENIEINNVLRSDSNRINNITINNKNFRGTDIRKILSLRSTDFDITVVNNEVYITTRGYGHGVGMSQYGANGMAKDGYNYQEILNFFYKNIEIVDI